MGKVGTFCRPCWASYHHPERHTKCRQKWSDGHDTVVCICNCTGDPADVAKDGEQRRALRERMAASR